MKSIIGNAARKEQFFPRPDIRAKILNSLNANQNLLISSPRRVGKTSILLNLVDEPDENYYAVFVNTESCDTDEKYFEQILKAILDADNLEGFGKLSKDAHNTFKKWGEKIAGFTIAGIGLTLNKQEKISYYEQLNNFLGEVNLGGKKILLLIDEFPATLEHIINSKGNEQAAYFLNQNRALRQNPDFQHKISFVYTGSVGLLNVARKMKATDRVNDLDEIKIGPLKKSAAFTLASGLFMGRLGYEAPEGLVDYMLGKIDLFLPFYIQLIVKEVHELLEFEELQLSKKTTDIAFDNLIKNGNIHLQHYKDRLSKIFLTDRLLLVVQILNAVKKAPKGLHHDDILNLAIGLNLQGDLPEILDALEHDGYLVEKNGRYFFYSVILKHWWK